MVVKMDIEGAEYDVVPHLLREKVADLIDELFLEIHTETNTSCKPPHDAGRHRPDAMRLLTTRRRGTRASTRRASRQPRPS